MTATSGRSIPPACLLISPVNLHNYGQELHRCKRPNVVVVGVSSMDEHGYCCVSCDLQWEMESFYSADKIIFEVNPRIPHLPGDCALPVAMADVIIESDLTLYELQDPPIGEAEKAVAQYAAEMVHDGDCIQLGFGGIPNAIGFELMNRHDLGHPHRADRRFHGPHDPERRRHQPL
ncbi:MAG: hypothetical protein ACLUNZ_10040 [Evtepia sp.]